MSHTIKCQGDCGADLPYSGRGRPPQFCESCRSERLAERQRAYYEANKAEIAGQKRAYYEANKAEPSHAH